MLNLQIKYKSGETRHITNNLNEQQAKALIGYLQSSEYGMEKAIITKIDKN